MTAIAYRSGIIAADSRETTESEAGGISVENCQKLFRRHIFKRDIVIGTAGGTYAGMVFLDWFGTNKPVPESLYQLDIEEDFEVLVLDRGKVYKANHLCRLVESITPFTAIGCGRKAALAALYLGRSARVAVETACLVDPLCGGPVTTMSMPKYKK